MKEIGVGGPVCVITGEKFIMHMEEVDSINPSSNLGPGCTLMGSKCRDEVIGMISIL